MTQLNKIIKILLVEDNPDDIDITKRALKEANVVNELWIARDGQEALDFLQYKGARSALSENQRPGLMLLDINLPKLNGMEVLKKIKQDPHLKRIPAVMLTISKTDEDIVRSYNDGCNSFIQKPVDFESFVEVVKQISLYWGLLNLVPPNGLEEEYALVD